MTLTLTKRTAPATPAASKLIMYVDSTDPVRVKAINADGTVHVLSKQGLVDKNNIMNGGLMIQQRVAIASTAIVGISTTTRAGVVADRWAVTTSVASNLNWQQVDSAAATEALLNSKFYGSIISATAGKKVMLSQFIINKEMAHLRGQKVRLQCKISQKVGAAQTYRLGLLQLAAAGTVDVSPTFLSGAWSTTTGVDPAWNTNLLAITPDASPTGDGGTITGDYLNITTGAAWARAGCVFTVPTTAKNLVPVIFSNATGGTTDNISITEFGMYLGPEIRDWVEEPLQDQLLKCQAYYAKTFPYLTVPAQNAGTLTSVKGIVGVAGANALACSLFWRFPTSMWKTPVTVTTYSPGAAAAQVRRISGTPAEQTATAVVNTGTESTDITATGDAAGIVGDRIAVHITADSETVN